MPIRTLLLDLDGTVLDTREFILAAYIHTLAEHKISTPTMEDLRAHMAGSHHPGVARLVAQVGRPIEDIYAELSGREPAPLVEFHRSFQADNLDLVTAFPGARRTLETLHAAGIRLAAVTSRSRRTSVRSLEVTGLEGFFDAVVSAEDVSALKPDPAPLRHALMLLGAATGEAAIAGDTSHDILAGQALGIFTIGALYGFGPDGVRAANPDVLIESITALPAAVGLG